MTTKNEQKIRMTGVGLGIFAWLLFFVSCGTNLSKKQLENGIWKAELLRNDGNAIIFNFKVTGGPDTKKLSIYNADNRLQVDSILTRGDSVFIYLPFFDSHFSAKIINGHELSGNWIKENGDKQIEIPFKAVHGDSSRLVSYADPSGDVSGTWETTFHYGSRETQAIGLFDQNGDRVTGTFLTPVGDYRFLEGVLSGDTLKLSGFDGSHALYFTALVEGDSIRNGNLYSLNHKAQSWSADKKEYDTLPQAYAVNNIPEGTVKLHLKLKDMRTLKEVSLDDDFYKNKVVILSILGAWCPNCMDEATFLTDYYNHRKDKDVEIIGIDFERTDNFEQSQKALTSFFKNFDIRYPILFSGVAARDPDLTQKVFSGLPVKISAFPTSIFIDKSGYVRKIHGGYNGPATGKYYEEFKAEFNAIVQGLLAEN